LQASPDVGIAILLTLLFSTPFEHAPVGLAPMCALLPTRTGDNMKSIHKLAYAAALTLSALNFAPSLASAQDAAGSFTLTHKVHWQNAVVPAGQYRFTIEPDGPAAMLTLHNMSGGKSFMMLVVSTEDSKPKDISRKLCQYAAASGIWNDTALRSARRNSGSSAGSHKRSYNPDRIGGTLVHCFLSREQI
jgi:hypothetical protein